MRFADIIGNEDAKTALLSMADSSRVAHAMMFYENDGCGALALALAYIQYLNCTDKKGGDSCGECPSCRKMAKLIHPDLHFVYPVNSGSKADASKKPTSETYLPYWRELLLSNPYFLENELYSALGIEGKSGIIAVAEAKFILEKLSLASVENGYKSIIVWLPEKMNAETANRLLKVVEEPPEKTLFVFITHNPDRVLQTIFSRCQNVRLSPLAKEEVSDVLAGRFGKERQEAGAQAALCGGSVGVALAAMGDREEYHRFMDMFSDLMSAVISRDLQSVLEVSDLAAALESKEKQKAFCIFAQECIRKIFLLQYNMEEIAGIPQPERDFFISTAGKCGKKFCSRVVKALDRSVMLLERNVNAKMVFCDLTDQMFLSV